MVPMGRDVLNITVEHLSFARRLAQHLLQGHQVREQIWLDRRLMFPTAGLLRFKLLDLFSWSFAGRIGGVAKVQCAAYWFQTFLFSHSTT